MTHLLMRRPDLGDLPPLPALSPGLILRTSRPGDAEPLAGLLRLAFDDQTWTVERVRNALTEAADVRQVYVAARGDDLVATASARLLPAIYPGSGYVHWVASHPAHRGQRLGYLVSLAVLHEFVRLGCRDAVLETDDFRLGAIKTYQSLGFVPVLLDGSHAERWAVIDAQIGGSRR